MHEFGPWPQSLKFLGRIHNRDGVQNCMTIHWILYRGVIKGSTVSVLLLSKVCSEGSFGKCYSTYIQ